MSEPELQISMTASELVALVDSRMAERDAMAQSRLREAAAPPPAPPLAPPPDELKRYMVAALKANKGDVAEAARTIFSASQRDASGRVPDPRLSALLHEWGAYREAPFRGSLVTGLVARLAVVEGIVPHISQVDIPAEPTSQLPGKSTTRGHQVG